MENKTTLLEFTASPKQALAAEKWSDQTTVEICYGGAKYGGKSFLGGSLIFHDALVYPGTFYFIARERLNDIRKYTIPTIEEIFRNWKLNFEDYAKYNGQDNYYTFSNGSRVYLIECTAQPSDPLFERFGSMQMTRGWIEEAGEVHHLAKENLKASIGRKLNDKYKLKRKLLLTCNPKKNFLYSEFYKPHTNGKLPVDKAFIQALPSDNIFGNAEYIKSLGEMKDPLMRQRLFLGNWDYADDETSLIEFDKIQDLFTNDFVKPGNKYITADIARFGNDKTIIMVWHGLRMVQIVELIKSDVAETATKILALAKEHQIGRSEIIADSDGVGGGVMDILKCKGFVNNSTPLVIASQKENYANLKSQCYFKLAEYINAGKMHLKIDNLKQRELIVEELEQVKRKSVDTDGKLAVLPKEMVKDAIGRSPDYSDTLMMRMYFEMKPKASAPVSWVYTRPAH